MNGDNKDEGKGFTINDRRIDFSEETHGKNGSGDRENTPSIEGPGWKMEHSDDSAPKGQTAELPDIDFSRFCLFLASSALINLGEAPNPETNKTDANLPLARQTINTLAMLEEKTHGNLTGEEAKLISSLLYDLRMRFLNKSRG